MKKQTAVEYLVAHITSDAYFDLKEVINQAKAMEREQIKDAWLNSLTKGDYNSAEEYYNETFKK